MKRLLTLLTLLATGVAHGAVLQTSAEFSISPDCLENGPHSLSISWDAATDSDGTVAGYVLRRYSTADPPAGTIVYDGVALSFQDTSVQADTDYSYTVQSYDDDPTPNYSAESAPQPRSTRSNAITINWYLDGAAPFDMADATLEGSGSPSNVFNYTGLTAETDYAIAYKCVNESAGVSAGFSGIYSFTTLAASGDPDADFAARAAGAFMATNFATAADCTDFIIDGPWSLDTTNKVSGGGGCRVEIADSDGTAGHDWFRFLSDDMEPFGSAESITAGHLIANHDEYYLSIAIYLPPERYNWIRVMNAGAGVKFVNVSNTPTVNLTHPITRADLPDRVGNTFVGSSVTNEMVITDGHQEMWPMVYRRANGQNAGAINSYAGSPFVPSDFARFNQIDEGTQAAGAESYANDDEERVGGSSSRALARQYGPHYGYGGGGWGYGSNMGIARSAAPVPHPDPAAAGKSFKIGWNYLQIRVRFPTTWEGSDGYWQLWMGHPGDSDWTYLADYPVEWDGFTVDPGDTVPWASGVGGWFHVGIWLTPFATGGQAETGVRPDMYHVYDEIIVHDAFIAFPGTAGGGGDTTPPVISNVSSGTPGPTTATITATTDEAATCVVNYGLTASYGTTSPASASGTSHSIPLSGLTADTTYHYSLTCQDAVPNVSSPTADATFLTGSLGAYDGTCETVADLAAMPPGTWCEVLNSRHDAAEKPANEYDDWNGTNSPAYDDNQGDNNNGIKQITDSWAGGAMDTLRSRLMIYGGGHNAYNGNEVLAFDIATMSWIRLTDPSESHVDGRDPYPDGTPSAKHTYNSIGYDSVNDRFLIGGGCLTGPSTPIDPSRDYYLPLGVLTGDTKANRDQWVQMTDMASWGSCEDQSGFFDARTGRWHRLRKTSPQLHRWYDYGTQVWNDCTGEGGWDDNALYFNPDQEAAFAVGNNQVYRWDLSDAGYAANCDRTGVTTTGPQTAVTATGGGVDYDTQNDRAFAWVGGTTVYSLDNSNAWVAHTVSGSNLATPPPTPTATSDQLFGKWRYVPAHQVFILYRGWTNTNTWTNVFFYKPPTIQ